MSVLLSASFGASWIRSYFWEDWYSWRIAPDVERHVGRKVDWRTASGCILLQFQTHGDGTAPRSCFDVSAIRHTPIPQGRRVDWIREIAGPRAATGLATFTGDRSFRASPYRAMWYLVFPLWVPVLIASMYPVGTLGWWLHRRRRLTPGRCVGCGYDLRESVERCPECGKPFSSRQGQLIGTAGRASNNSRLLHEAG